MRESGKGNTMSFVLPVAVAKRGAPEPAAEEVELEQLSGGKFAVFRFSGLRSNSLEQKSLQKLREWMGQRGLKADGVPSFAYYNPPWVPGFMRRNEVLVPIQP